MKKIIAMLAVAVLTIMLMGATLGGTAYATGNHDKTWVCHPVEGKGETGNEWNLIKPDKASSHIDESTGAGKHTRKNGDTDKYAVKVSGQWSCGGDTEVPPAEGKPVTLCHAEGNGTYSRLTVQLDKWLAEHKAHEGNDIWKSFSYETYSNDANGEVVTTVNNVPASGNTDLLDFKDCKLPKENTPVTKPVPTFKDECGRANDVDLAVAPGTGYTVGQLVKNGYAQSITVTLNDGYEWADGSTNDLTFEHTFTGENCDLPVTGGEAQYNTMLGGLAIAAMLITLGGVILLRRRN